MYADHYWTHILQIISPKTVGYFESNSIIQNGGHL